MYCSSETCPHAWDENIEQKCYDCKFMIEPVKTTFCSPDTCGIEDDEDPELKCFKCSFETRKEKTKTDEPEEDCPGQLFFNFFSQKQS